MMTRANAIALMTLTAAISTAACAGVPVPKAKTSPAPPSASLWSEPTDLATRDLFYGPWGKDHAPDPQGVYKLESLKHTGVNLGMTVEDEQGREWSVKQPYPGGLDPEGPVEVGLSRLRPRSGTTSRRCTTCPRSSSRTISAPASPSAAASG
jgi:hypothetical protein